MESSSDSRILLTGASGFIGQVVVPLLLSEGAEIMALTTKPTVAVERWGIQAVDLLKVPEKAILDRVKTFAPGVLLHLGWSGLPDYSADACLDNVASSIQVIRMALASGVSRIVGVGSCWEYGELQGELSEHLSTAPTSMFAQSKSCLRQLLSSVEQETSVETRWARIFYAYGSGQREGSLIPSAIRAWRAGSAPDLRDTQSAIDLIHVEDVASGLIALTLRSGPSGVFNLGSGVATRVSDVVELVRAQISGQQKAVEIDQRFGNGATWADIGAVHHSFGWSPRISLPEGIGRMLY
jgi:nucleoside-diphosphate-sugar epimerase